MAFVTSAIREAPNGEDVLSRVREATGVALQVLSGEDEARLTFLAARRWFGWSSGTLLVVDIGGGSLELAAGMDEDPDAASPCHSVPGGSPATCFRVTRPRRRWSGRRAAPSGCGSPPPCARSPRPGRPTVPSAPPRRCGPSPASPGRRPSSDGPYAARSLERAALASLVADLATMTAHQRERLSGVSASRSHQLLAGALVAEAAMDLLDLDRLEICPWALREGVILSRLDAMR